MNLQTYSSRDFTRDISAAKRAAVNGPVFITDRGVPAFALLNISDYYGLRKEPRRTLLQVMDEIAIQLGDKFSIEDNFELPPRSRDIRRREVDLS